MSPWLGVGYIPGGLNTSDGLAKSMSSANLRSLMAENTFQIVTEQMKNQIRKKLHASKHYIVYPDTTQGQRTLNEAIRKKARLGVSWQIAWFPLKLKLLIRRLRVIKPFSLRGIEKGRINLRVNNFEFS